MLRRVFLRIGFAAVASGFVNVRLPEMETLPVFSGSTYLRWRPYRVPGEDASPEHLMAMFARIEADSPRRNGLLSGIMSPEDPEDVEPYS